MKTRTLTAGILAALTLAMLCSNYAQACRIIDPRPIVPQPQPAQPIATRSHTAEISIENQAANVKVKAVFYNPNNFRMEGTYFFPLPKEVAVSSFSMRVNGKEMQGELLDAERARKVYEDIVRKMKDPGLLEFVGMQMLKVRVFPIEPHSEVEVRFEYSHLVEKDSGFYRLVYPLASAMPQDRQTIGKVAIKVSLNSQGELKNIYSPTHSIDTSRQDDHHAIAGFESNDLLPDRDFELIWSESDDEIGATWLTHKAAGEDDYFMLLLSPKVEIDNDKVIKKDVIFVLDKSGSMADDDKIVQAKAALRYCLSKLRPEDNFGILAFSTATESFREGLVPATADNIQAAKVFLEKIDAAGGTAIDETLGSGMQLLASAKNLPMMLFLTDGLPTVGEENIDIILKNTAEQNRNQARVFSFGLGYDVNTKLLDRLSREGHGVREYVKPDESIEVKISNLYAKVESPVLTNIEISSAGHPLREVYPRPIPDIFRGSQLVLLGRYEAHGAVFGDGKFHLRLTGKVGNKMREYNYSLDLPKDNDADFIPSLWAVRKVGYLLEQIRLHGKNEELVDEVTRLGKKHGIATPYTSFLVVDENVELEGVSRQELEVARREARIRLGGAVRLAEEKFSSAIGKDAQSASESADLYAGTSLNQAAPAQPARAKSYFQGTVMDNINNAVDLDNNISSKLIKDTQIRHQAGKTFYLKEGVWTDSIYDEKSGKEIITVEFVSEQYFALLRDVPELTKFLSLGENVIVVHEGKVYKISKGNQ
ncbi:MAG: VWA domain-containing protein [Planctomycetes bacterium]|nr:VWA domain-containing protein [Planctomycetota bacterium]